LVYILSVVTAGPFELEEGKEGTKVSLEQFSLITLINKTKVKIYVMARSCDG